MLGLAFANGTVRVAGLQRVVDETTARQISTATLLALLAGYVWVLHRRRTLPDARTALAVGGAWTLLTLGFEFGFGHYVSGTPWPQLLADYDITRGRIWVLVPIATLIAPAVVRAAQSSRSTP
jgi:apolipoprotein N-acyltransferase